MRAAKAGDSLVGSSPAMPKRWMPTDDTGGVGFNPFRQQRRRPSDYVFVAAALVVVAALLLWALVPR